MSDALTGLAGESAGGDWGDDLPVAEVQSLFVTLGKAFRAFQLYDRNNPVRQRFVESLRAEFTALWTQIDKLPLRVAEDNIYLADATVYGAESRADSLAFLFFRDGVREIIFMQGIEGDVLERLLGVLQKARKLVPEGEDLLTVLWEEDLQYFVHIFVDLLAEGVELPEPGAGSDQKQMKAALQALAEGCRGGPPESGQGAAPPEEKEGPATVSKDDFNPTLYALDPREMEILAGELRSAHSSSSTLTNLGSWLR